MRGGEDLAGADGVETAGAQQAGVQRLVAGASSRNQRDNAVGVAGAGPQVQRVAVYFDQAGVGQGETACGAENRVGLREEVRQGERLRWKAGVDGSAAVRRWGVEVK